MFRWVLPSDQRFVPSWKKAWTAVAAVERSCSSSLVAKEWRSRWGASLGSSYQPKDDFVEGELKVLSSSNVLGRCIPLQAAMHRVRPASSGESNLLRSTLTMHATSLVVRPGVIERPEMKRTTHVSERPIRRRAAGRIGGELCSHKPGVGFRIQCRNPAVG